MPETVFIYALCEPGTKNVRYIGMTTDVAHRLRAHLSGSPNQNSRLGVWMRELQALNLRPDIHVIRESSPRRWRRDETHCIRVAREMGYDLVNGNNGGGGQVTLSEDHRQRIRDTMKGRCPSKKCLNAARKALKGAKKTAEHRAKLSAAHTGLPWSAAQRAALEGRKLTAAHKAKLSAANTGVPWSKARRTAYLQRYCPHHVLS